VGAIRPHTDIVNTLLAGVYDIRVKAVVPTKPRLRRYKLRTGCLWRALPSDHPKWRTVHSYWTIWSRL